MYLSFTEYKSLGGSLEQLEFNRQEYSARKEIDFYTFGRLQGINPVPKDLKMCTMELIERGLCGSLDGEDFTSKSSGSLSVTKEDRRANAEALIRKYLSELRVDGLSVFYAGNA